MFVWLNSITPFNSFFFSYVGTGVFLGWTSNKKGSMCLAQVLPVKLEPLESSTPKISHCAPCFIAGTFVSHTRINCGFIFYLFVSCWFVVVVFFWWRVVFFSNWCQQVFSHLRVTVRIKCLAQGHNKEHHVMFEPGTFDSHIEPYHIAQLEQEIGQFETEWCLVPASCNLHTNTKGNYCAKYEHTH